MSYVDVFISHGQHDRAAAKSLKARITGWGFSCYIDAEDPLLQRKEQTSPAQDRALAEHIRGRLRNCRSIIYAYSARSLQSRWMQWELGFFDGRWGPRQIGLYDLDEGRTATAHPGGVLEYLHIYEELTPATLQDFLRAACSTRALADRADVDVDRIATLLTAMSRDPVNFTMDAFTYMATLQQQFWSRIPGLLAEAEPVPGPAGPAHEAMADAMRRATENLRNLMQPFAAAMRPPEGVQQRAEATTGVMRDASEETLRVSR